jgi:hypothetical protein
MSNENEHIEEQNLTSNKEVKTNPGHDNRPGFFRSLIDGEIITRQLLVKQLPFVFYISFLCALYIANRYSSEKVVRLTHDLQDELKDLRAEHISITSELMQLSQQSKVLEMLTEKNLALSESVEPPKIIVIKENN